MRGFGMYISGGKALIDEIGQVIIKIGIMPCKKGFNYLRKCILIYSEGEPMTRKLYMLTGEEFGVPWSRVERCIRTAIKSAYEKGMLHYINEVLNCNVFNGSYPLTNQELISLLGEYFRIN